MKGKAFTRDEVTEQVLFEDVGIHSRYAALTNEFNAELERELGNDEPADVVVMRVITEDEARE